MLSSVLPRLKTQSKMEPTPEQLRELYKVCSRLTRQMRWHIRWIEQMPGSELVVISSPADSPQRRFVVTIMLDGECRYGSTQF